MTNYKLLITNNKKFIYIGLALLLSILVLLAGFFAINRFFSEKEEVVYLRPDEGLIIDFIRDERGDIAGDAREIFEPYRLYDSSGLYENTTFGNINITRTNAEVFVKYPDGTEEEVTSGKWFYPLKIIPSSQEGIYVFTFKLETGEVYKRSLDFLASEEVSFIKQSTTRRAEDDTELTAFGLGDLDLTKATSIFRLTPSGAAPGGYPPVPNVDKYYWLNLEELEDGEHIFFAKVDGRWYYSIVNYPEDF